jgi:hypothetical protein
MQSDASSTNRWVLLSSGEITPTEPKDQAFAATPPSSVRSDVSEDPRGRKMRLYAASVPVEPVPGEGAWFPRRQATESRQLVHVQKTNRNTPKCLLRHKL